MEKTQIVFEPSEKLSLAVDQHNRYPGETAEFSLRFIVPDQPGAKLQVQMPQVMKVESYKLPEGVSAKICK